MSLCDPQQVLLPTWLFPLWEAIPAGKPGARGFLAGPPTHPTEATVLFLRFFGTSDGDV